MMLRELIRLTQPECQIVPEQTLHKKGHWRGRLCATEAGNTGEGDATLNADLEFCDSMIDGLGRALDCPANGSDAEKAFHLTGIRVGKSVEFQIWFSSKQLSRAPFICSGALSDNEREMAGTWTIGCFDPRECGCSGGRGTFTFKRID